MTKSAIVTLLVSMILCASAFAENENEIVLAKIGDTRITMSDFSRIIGFYDLERQKILKQNPQFKATILQRIVQGMVISYIVRDKGFDKRADVKEQLELLSNDFLSSEYLRREVVDKIEVSEDDMVLYYKAHQEDFITPEMVRARYILIKVDKSASEEDKKKAKEKAENIRKMVMAGEDFEKLASEYSDDNNSKTRGGDLGFFPRGKMSPDFEKVAFSLKPGEVRDVETPNGFQIVKVEEKKEASLEPYDRVKDEIREKVLAEFKKARLDEFVEKAMKDLGVEINLEPFLSKK